MSSDSLKRALLVAGLLVFSGSFAHANVSLKNGNFFIGYKDIVYPGGFEPKIERIYNSKTPFQGIFGRGWGTEYEAYLTVSADGSVVVHEYGGGAENRFSPKSFDKGELDKAVGEIAGVAAKDGVLTSPDLRKSYEDKLRKDAMFRNDEWQKYVQRGKLKPRTLKDGMQLVSNKFSYQYVTKTKDGYVRTFDNGRVEKFDERGKLAQISDKNNNFIKLSYGKEGHLEKIVDNFNRKMFLTFNNMGMVESIVGENDKKAEYKYDPKGMLTTSKDASGNSYDYKYNNKALLSQILYSDKTSMDVEYFGLEKQDNVRSVKDRDGTQTDYSYDTDARDPSHITVGVMVKGKDGKPISKSAYEYYFKYKPAGEEWTYKLVTTIDGDRTETVYNECCGLPLMIKRGTQETRFEYDTKGHVTKKETPTEMTELAYDAKVGKVSKVTRFSKTDKKNVKWSTFEYDAKGNLVFAKNSDKRGVRLFYDQNGRISSMVDQNKRRIDFKYNENSKPVEIRDPQLGTIRVTYSNSGEIKKVESTAGRKIALQVTSAFQNLLDIIRPAGVSLSF